MNMHSNEESQSTVIVLNSSDEIDRSERGQPNFNHLSNDSERINPLNCQSQQDNSSQFPSQFQNSNSQNQYALVRRTIQAQSEPQDPSYQKILTDSLINEQKFIQSRNYIIQCLSNAPEKSKSHLKSLLSNSISSIPNAENSYFSSWLQEYSQQKTNSLHRQSAQDSLQESFNTLKRQLDEMKQKYIKKDEEARSLQTILNKWRKEKEKERQENYKQKYYKQKAQADKFKKKLLEIQECYKKYYNNNPQASTLLHPFRDALNNNLSSRQSTNNSTILSSLQLDRQ